MKKLMWHQAALFFVLGLLTVMRLLVGNVTLNVSLLWWWLGGVAGFLFVFVDRFIHVFMSHPEEALSVKLKELLARGRVINGLALALAEREKQDKLMIRSILFLFVWAVLAILTVTSVANAFSRGFMLGLSTHLVFDLGWDYFTGKRDIDAWFWQVRNVSLMEKKIFVWGVVGFYALIVWFL